MIALHRVEANEGLREAVRAELVRLLGGAELRFDERGRPWAEGVSFNVSHSGSLGLIAIAEGAHRIGVDVEQVRPGPDVRALAGRFFHPEEAAAVGDDRAAFFRCWTRKEAVVKALGLGLAHPLKSFVVDVHAAGPRPVRGVDGLFVTGLAVDDGYVAALAADDLVGSDESAQRRLSV
jgi:4'-phosphopantetheinyl transferase